MPNYTSNLNLYKWDKSDKKLDTITETASTMDKIDTALNNATNTANIAKTTADTAKSTADTAKSTADGIAATANSALTTANSATTTANNAVTTANAATTTANDAKTTANTVQSQFNQVVAEAGSNNPEVVQARSGEVNLNTRLDKFTSQLAESAKRSYWKDVKQDYGAKGDGTTDDTTALFNFFTGMANAVDSNYKGTTKFVIPAGNYLIGSIDLSTIFGAHVYTGLQLEMDTNARFIAKIGTTGSLLNITPPNNGLFMYCEFRFGILDGNGVASNGIRFRYVLDSDIFINRVTGFQNNSAVLCDMSGTPVNSFFNNSLTINSLDRNTGGNGLATLGNTTATQYGVQGNQFKINQIYQNKVGVYNDVLGAQNSEWNIFDLGACEFNTNYGIIDNNGANIWRVGNTNSNTNGGFLLNTGAVGIPHITGYFSDQVVLGGRARITNAQANFDSITTPALPASATDYTHQFSNPARIFITGGTVSVIKIDGVITGLTSGMVLLYPGETINITYSVAPTWTWISL